MTPKLPVISGDELIKALGTFGYVEVRQKGSHVRMHHLSDPKREPVTIPRHGVLKRGVPRQVLRDSGITVEQLIEVF